MRSDAQRRATAKYVRKNYKQYAVRFNLWTDADIIEILDGTENKADYIRQLIREDQEKHVQKRVQKTDGNGRNGR